MRYFPATALISAAFCLFTTLPALAFDAGRQVTDATGRAVQIPLDPVRVFAAGPPASTLLYTLKPQAMIGWARAPKASDLRFLRPEVADLPELGRLTGKGDTLNLEVLLAQKPDLILDYGTVNATYTDLAARVQQQAGVPYVLIDGGFAELPRTLRQLGDILAVPERGAALAAYAEAALGAMDEVLARIPADQRPSVYLARGPEGLETAPKGAINAEIIERAGGRNVVDSGTSGLVTVSPEQIQLWAPDIIITLDADFAAKVGSMPQWQGIPAVENARVYLAPSQPFGFIDTPPSVNRLIGLKWLAHKFYPQHATADLRTDVAAFYQLFYAVELDGAAVTALLGE